MPINVSVINSVTDRKRFSSWFQKLKLKATCCVYEITTEENDTERFESKRRGGIRANANKHKAGITHFVTEKHCFVLFLKC